MSAVIPIVGTTPDHQSGGTTESEPPGARRPYRRTAFAAAGWVLLVVGCYQLSEFGEMINLPAPDLLAGLVVGMALALTGLVTRPFPRQAGRASQALVGVVMGSYLDPDAVASVAGTALPLAAVTAATVAISVGVAAAMARFTPIPRTDATLGMVPGGSAAIVSCAEDLGADGRFVALAQYTRVGLVALTAPAVAWAVAGAGAPDEALAMPVPDLGRLVERPVHQIGAVVILAAVCLTGVVVGRRLRLPAPLLLGPMVVTALFSLTNAADGFSPDGPLKDMVFVAIGLEVGLRFTRSTVARSARLLPHLLAATVAMCAACAGLAWGLGAVMDVPFLDAYLATTPGGINAVLATAESTGTDVPLVSTVQALRLFVVVLAIPPIIRWLAPRSTR
jgi:membrane AbrB-like protein